MCNTCGKCIACPDCVHNFHMKALVLHDGFIGNDETSSITASDTGQTQITFLQQSLGHDFFGPSPQVQERGNLRQFLLVELGDISLLKGFPEHIAVVVGLTKVDITYEQCGFPNVSQKTFNRYG